MECRRLLHLVSVRPKTARHVPVHHGCQSKRVVATCHVRGSSCVLQLLTDRMPGVSRTHVCMPEACQVLCNAVTPNDMPGSFENSSCNSRAASESVLVLW